ncbi:MAG: multicopper oxidase domain-containing protein [Bacteroidetes bacterium]|nr:multicopper oxidase domain-containing protein [Bacteroidota bacterium]
MKNQLLPIFLFFISLTLCSQNQLIIPGTITSTDINLTLQNGTHEFFPGESTATMGVNGNILGPTLMLNQGESVNINVTNNLGEETTIHWHGLHVSAENDGGPHTIIDPGTTWNPQFTVLDRAATYWYHPHLLDVTDEHASKGIAGFIIVKDADEAALDLPRTYGIDDIPLAIQTKDFDSNFQIVNHANNDDSVMVNATINPETDLPAQVVRLRLLNGSSQRVFNFGFSGNMTFYQIATDGGLRSEPLALTRLPLAPGERSEILINLSGMSGQTLQLMSYASEFPNGIYGATYPGMGPGMVLDNYNPNPLNGTDFNILQLNVVPQTGNPVTTIPNSLVVQNPYLESDSDQSRYFLMQPVNQGPGQLNGMFTINGVNMDMSIINVTVPLDNIEIWTIQNNSGISHPFHVHDVQYYILDIDDSPPPAYAQGWKDTFLVPAGGGTVRFITKFEDFADDTVPYMYHCHMLTHEDNGMMGQFVVVDLLNVDDFDLENEVLLYPNPSEGVYMTMHLRDSSKKILSYAIINELGQIISYHKVHDNEISNKYSFPIYELASGTYFIKIYTENQIITKKFIKNN